MAIRNGTTANDVLDGTDEDDSLYGFAGADNLFGLGGNDLLNGGAGNDLLDGGSGNDTASYADTNAGVSVSLGLTGPQTTGGAGNDTLIAIENIVGSAFADRLSGDSGDNILDGGAGLDTVSYAGAAAGVTIDLARGDAQATGGAGTDTLRNFENVTGSAFDDRLSGTAGNNVFTAGAGTDTLSYANAGAGVVVNLAVTFQQDTVGAGRDTLFGVENLIGSAFADALAGTDGDNSLDGGAGVDRISYANAIAAVTVSLALQSQAQATGGSGSDMLRNFENLTGSGFDDLLAGDAGNNVIAGGLGIDTVSYAGGEGVQVDLALTTAQQTFGAGTDTLFGIENLIGSDFVDWLFDNAGDNAISGGGGDDEIVSTGGRDAIDGGDGSDTWRGEYADSVGDQTVSFDAATEILTLPFGTTLAGIEAIELLMGAGNDRLSLNLGEAALAGDSLFFDGGEGSDTIGVDFSAGNEVVSLGLVAFGSASGGSTIGGTIEAGGGVLDFTGIEHFSARLGAADDSVLLATTLALATGSTVAIDAGGGIDLLTVDLRGASRIDPRTSFIVAADGSALVLGNQLLNFERFDVTLGSGALNSVVTGAGDDIVRFSLGTHDVDGGDGTDTLIIAGNTGNFTLVADGTGDAELVDTDPRDGLQGSIHLRSIEAITFYNGTWTSYAVAGTDTADTLAGTSLIDQLSGLAGDDRLTGFAGEDSLYGGAGNDTAVFRGNRADYLVTSITPTQVTVRDILANRDGTDTLVDVEFLRFADVTVRPRSLAFTSPASFAVAENALGVGSVGASDPEAPLAAITYAITGGADAARFTIDAASGALAFVAAPDFEAPGDVGGNNVYDLVISADNGTAESQAITVTVTDIGEGPSQSYTGTSAANVFAVTGTAGWTLAGLGGADTLTGGGSTDVIIGGKGNDILAGGGGDDLFRFAAGDGIDAIDGGAGFDRILATSANAVVGVSGLAGIDAIDAGGFAGVRLAGTAAANSIDLSGVLLTGVGSISGLGGSDTIIGSAGADRIIGGGGSDTLTGGDGADVFAYALARESGFGGVRADRIADFTAGEDRIDLGNIDADAAIAGNQAFAFIGDGAFTGTGQLRVGLDTNGNIALFGNISGSLAADFQISLLSASAPAIGIADLLL